MRPEAWCLIGLLLVAAGPTPEPLPVPPIPPDALPATTPHRSPTTTRAAPRKPRTAASAWHPRLYRRDKTYTQGEGYMPGSSQRETEQERLNKPAPSLNLRMSIP